MQGLDLTWTDPRGKTWKLDGSMGIRLDLDQEGLGWGAIQHDFSGPGALPMSRVDRSTIALKVIVGEALVGDAFLDLRSEWWSQANSPFMDGTLTVARRNGRRTKRLRLHDTPDTVWKHNPLLPGEERPVELWALIGMDAWWRGDTVTTTLFSANSFATTSVPFFGPSGRGMPLHLSPLPNARKEVANPGQAPLWPTWIIRGPFTDLQLGSEGNVLVIDSVPANQELRIVTDPRTREITGFDGARRLVGGQFSQLAPGAQAVRAAARVVGGAAQIRLEFTPLFAEAF